MYSDAESSRKLALKESKGKSGVYRWLNIVTGDSYVGSSIELSRRLADYYSIGFIECRNKKGIK